jgi:hypothetical protein
MGLKHVAYRREIVVTEMLRPVGPTYLNPLFSEPVTKLNARCARWNRDPQVAPFLANLGKGRFGDANGIL